MLDILLQAEDIVNAAKHTLATAIEIASVQMCEQLLEHSANTSSCFSDGDSALHKIGG